MAIAKRPSSAHTPAKSSPPSSRPPASRPRSSGPPPSGSPPASWTFLTNHAHVLICIAGDPNARIRDLADRVGITERAVQKIIQELEEAGYLTHEREGRRNVYRVSLNRPLRHPVESHRDVSVLVDLVTGPAKR